MKSKKGLNDVFGETVIWIVGPLLVLQLIVWLLGIG